MTWDQLLSVSLSVIASIISIITFYKNVQVTSYELSSEERKEILNWFERTTETLIYLRENVRANNSDLKRVDYLVKLSTLIERGRFFFPNISSDYGKEKSQAFRGYRHPILDLLIYSYRMAKEIDAVNYVKYLELLQREFTSAIFEVCVPHKFIKHAGKFVDVYRIVDKRISDPTDPQIDAIRKGIYFPEQK